MTSAIEQLLATQGLATTAFAPTSRYHGLDTLTHVTADGQMQTYVKRRFIPSADRYSLLQVHAVVAGDRTDKLAATYLGDPEQYWKLCDANGAMRPNELTETVGRRLRITLPEGIPGTPDD